MRKRSIPLGQRFFSGTLRAVAVLYRLLRPLLFLLDAERAHALVGLFLRLRARLWPRPKLLASPDLGQTVLGVHFPSPVGLAAGMDKGEALLPAWFGLGFGFVEVGTVTPRPQQGNVLPRLFRLIGKRAVINRMGFNNPGMAAVAARLKARPRQPGPVGANIGKNKDTENDRAAEDYVAAFKALAPHADYVAINVSSPNTPGLRLLQGAEQIAALVRAVGQARDELKESLGRRVPILVKVSPDEPDEGLFALADAALAAGADGLIASNTTLSRAGVEGDPRSAEQGGLSGAPLRERALRVCARLYQHTGGKVALIGVGGISSAEDAYARIRAGASLVQVYTALVYQGPTLPRQLNQGLSALLKRDGLSLAEARGKDAALLATQPGPV